ncbi:MAG: hypothetical protein GEV10_14085 [Streptosporangiales bacterium]|nr:hypothetical protein [Streptosporangiales bacterium]
MADTIDRHGDPLAFEFRRGTDPSPLSAGGRAVFTVEARHLAHHQKEAIVTEGATGSAWRLASDEGPQLTGTDLAPFPLGYFNAGMQADLSRSMRELAPRHGVTLDGLRVRLVHHYWLTGSFVHGTGEGHAEPPDLEVEVDSGATADAVDALVSAAIEASPAFALLRAPLTDNTFALYINGIRRPVEGVASSSARDASDPYRTYTAAPRPLDADARRDLVEKTGREEDGTHTLAPATVQGKLVRDVFGDGTPLGGDGLYDVDTWLGIPGASHFRLVSDGGTTGAAPSGLALLSAGVAFCYMTQLLRYIESMKMQISGVRLVQHNPFVAGAHATAEPIDTHLFLNGEAPEETHVRLLTVAARTCYLHACAKTPLEPLVRVIHNGHRLRPAG